jgi:hypothetical protein
MSRTYALGFDELSRLAIYFSICSTEEVLNINGGRYFLLAKVTITTSDQAASGERGIRLGPSKSVVYHSRRWY